MNRKTMTIWIGVAASIAVILFGYVALSQLDSLWNSILPGRSFHTNDTRPVDIALTDPITKEKLLLRIPRTYLVKRENWKGGEQEMLYIQARLPKMEPLVVVRDLRGTPGSKEYLVSLEVFNNSTDISLSREHGDFLKAHDRTRSFIAEENRPVGTSSTKYALLQLDFQGLEHYRKLRCGPRDWQPKGPVERNANETCVDIGEHYFLSRDREKPIVRISCNVGLVDRIGDRLGCHASSGYRSHPLGYLIPYSQLHRWQEFDTGIRRMLDEFVADAGK